MPGRGSASGVDRTPAAASPDRARAYRALAAQLERHEEPSIRLWILTGVRGRSASSPSVREAGRQVRASPRVEALLSERLADGTIPWHPYAKWYGAHWVLVTLAELGYPPGDASLLPLLDQDLRWLASAEYTRTMGRVRGQPRLHASIDANAVWAATVLGLPDARIAPLVERLLAAQWPDGGWNCDRRAAGHTSSFTESLVPWRALAEHARRTGERRSGEAAARAAELFLRRRLFRRLRDGEVIAPSFVRLHYPCYWHYDVLAALTVAAESGVLHDGRCREALDLLEARWLPAGGFPAEERFYQHTGRPVPSRRSLVDWGGAGRRPNPFVSARALAVLHAAGRAGTDARR